MWRIVIVAAALLAAGCSPTTNDTTTTAITVNAEDAGVSASSSTTTTFAGTTTSTTSTVDTTTTTTTAAPTTTTTKAPDTTTTITAPEGNEPPEIEIVSPTPLSSHTAAYDADRSDFGAFVALSAITSDPNGDPVTVRWSSSTQGGLGTGESIVAWLSTGGYDASQPIITATATDQWGTATSVSVQIIVWIPSDT